MSSVRSLDELGSMAPLDQGGARICQPTGVHGLRGSTSHLTRVGVRLVLVP
jgi:hypothetical protein